MRRLSFALGEIEEKLRVSGRAISAEAVGKLTSQFSILAPEDFVGESRLILEGALLGERDLPADLIDMILQAMESVDKLLRT
jgi:hypothetical protein